MYDNIGGKIKGLAKAVFIVEAVAAVITGIALIANSRYLIPYGLLVMLLGPIVAYISSWLLYGFGELIDRVCEVAKNTSPETNNQEDRDHDENIKKIATTFKSSGIMDIPKRNK